jgi:hypothetical protein
VGKLSAGPGDVGVEPVRWLRSKDGGCTGCWVEKVV